MPVHPLPPWLAAAALITTASAAASNPETSTVHKLRHDSFVRAGRFIQHTGRPLEQALYAWEFDHGSPKAVVAALATFQNPDGGFAARLESDHRWQGSSATAAMVALRVLDRVKTSPDDRVVRSLVKYLLATFDEKVGRWHAMPIEANAAPHAPWWDVHADSGKCVVESAVFPTAAIAAHLRPYSALLPPGFLDRITRASLQYLEDSSIDIAMPDVDVLTDLAAHLPPNVRDPYVIRLREVLAKAVVRDPLQWSSYGIQPTSYVEAPASPFYSGLEADVAVNLDYIVSMQRTDGGWDPNWSWSDVNPSAWQAALKEIRASITLQNLEKLTAYQRIEGR
jgi:hypothetical protein